MGFFYQDNGEEDAALGNFGIWDQIEALRWNQKYISSFGGDKDKVRIVIFYDIINIVMRYFKVWQFSFV